MSGGEYNVHYKYVWRTPVNALPMSIKNWLDKKCEDKWSWYFEPHDNMNWHSEDWYKDQTLMLSFNNKYDLVRTKLCVAFN